MFQWALFVSIVALCLPGVVLMSAFSAEQLRHKPEFGMTEVSKPKLLMIMIMQNVLLIVIPAIIGTYFGPLVGIREPFLESLFYGETADVQSLWRQTGYGLLWGVVCTGVWLLAYYGYIRKRMDKESVMLTERLRLRLGLLARITSGGINEEVMFRFGLLTLLLWLASLIAPLNEAVVWISLVVTGVVFGLAHIPGLVAEGCKKTPLLVVTSLFGNLWVAIFCGYALLQFGLISAIVIHIVFHVMWYPFDRRYYRKDFGDSTAS
ncbi:type II CAAX prenyl endopeptidase Rce1 family protein [Paenibacillus sp. MBLB4367]|uniref:CPBP family glutamic-type intramembrane protease n=1 Tax=Paenibacillus sp. MBLB4367 TaxID=3384767 RepID=UPI0039080AE4